MLLADTVEPGHTGLYYRHIPQRYYLVLERN